MPYVLVKDSICNRGVGGSIPLTSTIFGERAGQSSFAQRSARCGTRTCLSLINRKQLRPRDFRCEETGAVLLSEVGRKTVLTAWQQRKRVEMRHAFLAEKLPLGLFIHVQAQLLARHLRGDLDGYPAFIWK